MSIVLVLGGIRSGKSAYAEELARRRGGDSVLYVATGRSTDREMEQRIAQHKLRRPNQWKTCEEPVALPAAISVYPKCQVVLVDTLSGWLANLLLAYPDGEWHSADVQQELMEQVDFLLGYACQQDDQCWILVSDEVGLGGVAATPLGRAFQDVVGQANQTVAEAADEVFLVAAGLPLQLKGER
ncbi:MAG: bifunctional adenosylcobinamide kinase/adenosylcobinamide-phosphate guanylyltransferase [Brevibacillus sp.]|nr:bifunctional adenosylcobinamide kinase/adenosylcobinamide-phosphate guanylyltransferase [Brevibacillus sp.]